MAIVKASLILVLFCVGTAASAIEFADMNKKDLNVEQKT